MQVACSDVNNMTISDLPSSSHFYQQQALPAPHPYTHFLWRFRESQGEIWIMYITAANRMYPPQTSWGPGPPCCALKATGAFGWGYISHRLLQANDWEPQGYYGREVHWQGTGETSDGQCWLEDTLTALPKLSVPHHTLGCFHPPSHLPTALWVTQALWSDGSLSLA